MLSKKDKEWLKEEIKKAVHKALTVEIQWEKVRDEKTGMPLAHKEYRTEDVFLPAFWVQHLKFYEGNFLGLQESVQNLRNSNDEGLKKLQVLAEFLIGMEPLMRGIIEGNSEQRHHRQAIDDGRDGSRPDPTGD